MKTTPAIETARQRKILYRKFVKGSYANFNKLRIDYVLDKVYKKLLKIFNKNELKVIDRLTIKGIIPETQKIIPVLQVGGKINHLYIADIVVGNTIIEVDGPLHAKQKNWDKIRDVYTSLLGYKTIRIPTSDLKNETIDSYLELI